MTTAQVMQLDCRSEENQKTIQRVLRQIKPLSKLSDETIPFDKIEKAIVVMTKKYPMRPRDFSADVWSNSKGTIWRCWIINDNDLSTIDTVYGLSVYEVFAKCAIRMYAEVKKGMAPRKERT